MLVFNFFFLPPVHSLTLNDSRNWLALAVYVVTSAVVSELAARSRRRATESELLAEVARSLLERGSVSGELDQHRRRRRQRARRGRCAHRARRAVGRAARRRRRDAADRRSRAASARSPCGARAGRTGGPDSPLLPALASLLAVAIDQERLAREALEAEALRRSDALKTALLRTVSHDLRSPLMTILTSASALSRPELSLGEADRAELLAGILSEAQRLDRLVSNLLDLSRLQAGAATPAPEVWAADSLVVQALSSLGESRRPRGCDALRRLARRTRRRPSDRAGAGQSDRECDQVLARPRGARRRQLHGSRGAGAGRRPRPGPRAGGDPAGVRAVPARIRAATWAAPGWAWRSHEASPRPTAGGCGPSRSPGRARRSCSPCRSRRSRRTTRERAAHPRGRRRAPDPAGALDQPARGRLHGRHRRDRGRRARRSRHAAARRGDPRPRAARRHRHGCACASFAPGRARR